MSRLRSLLSLVLVLVATVLVSCSSPQVEVPTTYSPEKIAQLEVYVIPIAEARGRMETLQGLIADQNWVDTQTYIHGPLGQLRQQMLGLSRSLLPKDQDKATTLAKEVFGHLERLDAAAKDKSISQAKIQFQEAIADFDDFLNLIPQAS
ncbi:MAG: photosystem II protein PsbQ [Synechocystis sp.]|nr:photosystem II protein PsbQ [Synechocystis sp.]